MVSKQVWHFELFREEIALINMTTQSSVLENYDKQRTMRKRPLLTVSRYLETSRGWPKMHLGRRWPALVEEVSISGGTSRSNHLDTLEFMMNTRIARCCPGGSLVAAEWITQQKFVPYDDGSIVRNLKMRERFVKWAEIDEVGTTMYGPL